MQPRSALIWISYLSKDDLELQIPLSNTVKS